jgi:hypothetical protein
MRNSVLVWTLLAALAGCNLGGCSVQLWPDDGDGWFDDDDDDDSDVFALLLGSVGAVQDADPRVLPLPDELVDQGDSVMISSDVEVIINIEQDLIVEELPDATVVGFENLTGYDLFLRYYADDVLQGVLVQDGETLLLDYPCLGSLELLSEDDIDPLSSIVVQSYDLADLFLNPDDFLCGDALLFTFDPVSIDLNVEFIALLP